MAVFEKILNVSWACTEAMPDRNWGFVLMKCNEELGEMSDAAFFVQEEKLEGEVADFIISIVDLFFILEKCHGPKADVIESLVHNLSYFMRISEPTQDPVQFRVRFSHTFSIGPNSFPTLVSSYGAMSRAINQPERSETVYSFHLGQCINNAISVLCNHYKDKTAVDIFRMLEMQIDLKLGKWKKKAGIL